MSSYVFIDSRVSGIERLIAGLAPDTQVVMLDPALDGIAQIAAALAGVGDLDSIHIVSHGSAIRATPSPATRIPGVFTTTPTAMATRRPSSSRRSPARPPSLQRISS